MADELGRLADAVEKDARSMHELASRLPTRTKTNILIAAVIVSLVAVVISLIVLLVVRSAQQAGHRTLTTDSQILALVNNAVGPAASKNSAAEEQHLIACLDNRIDYDTGHANRITAGCPAADIP
jgi:hypothetical protein